jgi:hypothetical protein
LDTPELSTHALTGQRVPEGLGADGDQIRSRTQEIVGVTA